MIRLAHNSGRELPVIKLFPENTLPSFTEMAVRKPHIYQEGYYFITFTNKRWLPLLQLTDAYDLIYSWFDYLKLQHHHVFSYVIMPNHIHLMLAYAGGDKSLNTLVGNGKRFMTNEIVKRLKAMGELELLSQCQKVDDNTDGSKQKKYTVFKNSFDTLHCYSEKFIIQKINYIHHNPCRKKWMLASSTTDYPYSSARYYERGLQGEYEIMTWMQLEKYNRYSDFKP